MTQFSPPPSPTVPPTDSPDPAQVGASQLGPSKTLAITSMVLGIAGIVTCIGGPIGVVIGIAAVVTGGIALTRRNPGRTQALVGVGCGALAVVLGVAAFFVYFSALGQARRVAKMTKSIANAHQIGMGLIAYSADYKDQLPESGADLSTRLYKYTQNADVFVSPNDPALVPGYIYVSRGNLSRANPGDVLLYENPAAPALAWAVLYVDGHVELKRKEEFDAIIAGLKASTGGSR